MTDELVPPAESDADDAFVCVCLQDVECIVFDGQYIVSSCLAGEIRVWDSSTGECITTIDRNL